MHKLTKTIINDIMAIECYYVFNNQLSDELVLWQISFIQYIYCHSLYSVHKINNFRTFNNVSRNTISFTRYLYTLYISVYRNWISSSYIPSSNITNKLERSQLVYSLVWWRRSGYAFVVTLRTCACGGRRGVGATAGR